MSFDNSRSTFNPWRDYFGVVMQQGRVQLDSDWNEWLAEFARRIQAGTLDILGLAGVPSTTPFGFKINAFQDTSGTPHVTIGAGRIYVDGILAENHGSVALAQWDPALAEWSGSPQTPDASEIDIDYSNQPYLPGAALPTGKGPFLVYLDVWQRDVTYLEDSGLVEKAVGIDTTGRRQTVWQVKLLDVSSVGGGVACSTLDSAITPWETVIQPSASLLSNGLVPSAASGPCSLSPATGYTGLENQLYRVEIHQGGTTTSSPPATFKWSRENASVATAVTAISSVTNSAGNPASQLTVQSKGRDQVLGFHPGDWIEIIDDFQELYGQPGELHQIVSINSTAKTIVLDKTVTSASFPLDSNGQTDPSRHTRIQRWDQAGKVYLGDGTTVWVDLNAAGSAGIPVPPPGTALILENGITVAFDLNSSGDSSQQSSFQSGDFWTFAARTADGSIQTLSQPAAAQTQPATAWNATTTYTPGQVVSSGGSSYVCLVTNANQAPPNAAFWAVDQAPPCGIHHHYCRLGIVDFNATPPKVVDCRQLFPALANPGIHITSVFLGSSPLLNDSTVSVQDLAHGINVVCDVPVDPNSISQPTCFVTVDVPAPIPTGGSNPPGSNPFIPAATVGLPVASNTINWAPTGDAQTALQNLVPLTGPPVLAHLTLKGNFIWAQGNPNVYLNGAVGGVPALSVQSSLPHGGGPTPLSVAGVPGQAFPPGAGVPGRPFPPREGLPGVRDPFLRRFTSLQLPSGDGRRSANFEMWFWLISQPVVTLSATAINFSTPQLVGTPSTQQSVTVTNNSSSATVTIAGVSGPNAGDFIQTNTCNGTLAPGNPPCTINVAFNPTAAGTRSAQITVTDSTDSNQFVIALTGTGIQPLLQVSPQSLNFSLQTVGTASGIQTVTLTNTGNSQLTISGISITNGGQADFVQFSNCIPPGGSGNLQPNQQCTINVQFVPIAAGSQSANLVIASNAGTVTIPLSGTGFVGTPGVSVSPTSLNFGTLLLSQNRTLSVTLTSTGNVALAITGMAITDATGSYSLVGNTCGGGSLQPGQQCTVSVRFTPTDTTVLNGQLQISHNAPGSPLTIPLTGTGQTKKPPKDTAIEKAAVLEQMPDRLSTLKPSSSTGTPPEGGGEEATRRAFISPEERPPVGPPRSDKPEDEPPNEGPKEE